MPLIARVDDTLMDLTSRVFSCVCVSVSIPQSKMGCLKRRTIAAGTEISRVDSLLGPAWEITTHIQKSCRTIIMATCCKYLRAITYSQAVLQLYTRMNDMLPVR